MTGQLNEYLWCVVVGALFCFTLGFGIGSNDVSNNFGTSIGSKAITLGKAIIIAAIFEFVGSVALGASVTDSVRKGVYYPEYFGEMPDMILSANLVALVTTTLWLLVATCFGLPVSTTHSLVGSMLGCGLAIGWNAINWTYIIQVIASWLVSPASSMLIGMFYFGTLRWALLRKPNSVELGFRWLWLLIFVTCSLFCAFFVFSNPMRINGLTCRQSSSSGTVYSKPCVVDKWAYANVGFAFGIALAGGAILTLVIAPFVYTRAKRKVRELDALESVGAGPESTEAVAAHHVDVEMQAGVSEEETKDESKDELELKLQPRSSTTAASLGSHSDQQGCRGGLQQFMENMPWKADLHTMTYDKSAKSRELAETVEPFGKRVECFFMTLQIISACVACLVHGANDVANAAAPFASVYSIFSQGVFEKTIAVPIWILVLAGSAIAVGLTFLGHRVIRRVGIELLAVTPSRGFCIEMASSTVMLVGSFIGFPLSTTHVTVGAMIGVALFDRKINHQTGEEIPCRKFCGLNLDTLNWRVAGHIAVAWVGTLLTTAAAAAALYSFVIYSPTRVVTRYIPISEIAEIGL
eukprot:Protomagalhaensia_wolfi_Nauph_80__651@NODE_136_length_3489_cov_200_144928_g101_i0_p1_GENE_NODE_136_length_3489_cov_200_144928_g101_i0NODE_136_length_3489_cov_200_144928_g101_i0_p1_ORF_typecomplete_len580_score122_62PHO4/PF01384_20/9_3e105Rax2/PF12768_7/5_1Rax2/PF12768_7/1e02_NODE_136_length_3489_cov_200_144928_g101_i04122151